MHFKFYLLLYTHLFFIHSSNAFNITTILNQYPSFSIFNRYLSETNVSSEINSRQTITVLAVSNDDVWRLSGKQHDGLDNLMRVHVVLDYFDVEKLKNLQNGTTQMTTLFQATGRAFGQQGFLKATVSKTGNVLIGSATRGVPVGAILVNSVAAEPFNISVLHINTEIVPVGMNFPFVSDSNTNTRMESPVEPPRCRHRKAPSLAPNQVPSHARSPSPSPNSHGGSPLEGAPVSVPSPSRGGSADAPASAKSPPSLAPKLAPSQARSPAISQNPPGESPSKGAPMGAPPGSSANAPSSTRSPPGGAPKGAPPFGAPPGRSANAPASTRSPPGVAPSGGFVIAPASTKSPPGGAPDAPLGGSANPPASAKPPPEGVAPKVAPSGGSANIPKSPPKSFETPPISPPKLADTPPQSPPGDTDRSSGGTSNSSLLVITIVLLCINLVIQT